MIDNNELVKVERYVNQTYNCSMSLLDGFDEEVTIMINISNKISGREFDLAYTMIDLLNQEIIKTVKFMLGLY